MGRLCRRPQRGCRRCAGRRDDPGGPAFADPTDDAVAAASSSTPGLDTDLAKLGASTTVQTDETKFFDSGLFSHLPAGVLTGDETDVVNFVTADPGIVNILNADPGVAVPVVEIAAIAAGGGF